ncbi:4-hydroxy-3-methylbut-2-enyl diphosphate reductase, partial [Patescibacteria group bacterium]|nr:4-hydroxy-3-methylbut-2-enyl diphosphate reductase [Patescibacteria group bacterium]
MKIFLPSRIGFCFGVTNALQLAELELKKKGDPVYSLGEIIHNPWVIEELTKRGMKVISDLSSINKGTVITRAHGIDPSLIKEGKRRGLRVIDATCPYVAKVQKIAKLLSGQSYQVVMIGSESHPEIRAVKANIPNQKLHILNGPAQVKNLPLSKKIGVIVQTTELLDNFQNIVKNLIERKGEIRVFNTICEVIMQS